MTHKIFLHTSSLTYDPHVGNNGSSVKIVKNPVCFIVVLKMGVSQPTRNNFYVD